MRLHGKTNGLKQDSGFLVFRKFHGTTHLGMFDWRQLAFGLDLEKSAVGLKPLFHVAPSVITPG